MEQVEVGDSWTVAGAVPAVQAAVNRFLRGRGMRVVGEQAGEVHARRGRWPARALGPRWCPARWLPTLAVVRMHQTGDGVAVRATVGEAWEGGDLSPRAMDRYHAHLARWMAALRARLPAPAAV